MFGVATLFSFLEKNLIRFSKYKFLTGLFSAPFSRKDSKKVLFVYSPNRISYCQIYPFLYYRKEFEQRFGVEFRFVNSDELQNDVAQKCTGADVVVFETWFTISEPEMIKLIATLKRDHPSASLHFVDSFAPTDLRLAGCLSDHVDSYIKKSLLKSRELYSRNFMGGTNLTDYYCQLYSLEENAVSWPVPDELFEKIHLSPTFFTGPEFLSDLDDKPLPKLQDRSIDVHARLALNGSNWYGSMRSHSEKAIKSLKGLNVVTGVGVDRKQFIREMENSKVCFSPFGYGEICWRDIEAIVSGCVLVKPDMGHLDMDPIIHVPNETYVPVKWDFSDLEVQVNEIIENNDLRVHIAEKAHSVLAQYVQEKRFVEKFAYLFC